MRTIPPRNHHIHKSAPRNLLKSPTHALRNHTDTHQINEATRKNEELEDALGTQRRVSGALVDFAAQTLLLCAHIRVYMCAFVHEKLLFNECGT